MSKISDSETTVVLRNLAIMAALFYGAFYALAAIFMAGFGNLSSYNGKEPFDWTQGRFWVDSGRPLAGFLSTLLSFTVTLPLLIYFVAKSAAKAWDYAATFAIWHWAITCAVLQGFPTNWLWWVAVVPGAIASWLVSELMCHYLRDMKEILLDH